MKLWTACASVLVASSVAQAATAPQIDRSKLSQEFVPNTFLIQVSGDASRLAKRGINAKRQLSNVVNRVKSRGISMRVKQMIDSSPDLFNGASVVVPEGTSPEDLLNVDGVEAVYPVRIFRRRANPVPEDAVGTADAPAEQVSTDKLLSNEDQTTGTSSKVKRGFLSDLLRAILTGKAPLPSAFAYRRDTFGPHVQIGLDQAQSSGYLGEGVKIAVIDEGVDYRNPILGGCFGRGCQISFGYDFVGDNYDGTNTPQPDNDPFADCTNHGTVVQGIIAALPNPYGFTGTAPRATHGHYRITSCPGVTTEDMFIAALTRAAADKVDVINLSYEGVTSWTDGSATQVLIDKLVAQGKFIISSAGNDGAEGMYFAEAPASTKNGVSTAANEQLYLPTYRMNVRRRDPIAYMSTKPLSASLPSNSWQLYFTSTDPNVKNDACSALPASTPDLTNRVVVVQRGGCTFAVKFQNIANAGGRVALIYNSAGLAMLPPVNTGSSGLLGVAALTNDAGLQLLSYYTNDQNTVVTFPSGPLVPASNNAITGVVDKYFGGIVSDYSIYGPTADMFVQPSFTAPGTNILTTTTMAEGGLLIARGTSFAAPLAAGSIAVILSARSRDNISPIQMRALLAQTSDRIPISVGSSTLDSVIHAGAGEINVMRAIKQQTIVEPFMFQLNDSAYFQQTQTLKLTNRGRSAMKYSFSITGAVGISTYQNGAQQDVLPATEPPYNDAASQPAQVNLPREVNVNPGGSRTVTFQFTAPQLSADDINKFPIYSGFINVQGRPANGRGDTETFSIAYFGQAARLFDMPVLDTTPNALGANLPFMAQGQDINNGGAQYPRDGSVEIYFRNAAASRSVTLDLVDAAIDFEGTIPSVTNARRSRARRSTMLESTSVNEYSKLLARAYRTFNQVPTVGRVYTSLLQPRNYLVNYGDPPLLFTFLTFDGSYTSANGTAGQAQVGPQYRLLLRALKITGDPALQDQYESWLSPTFTFTS
ncbi:hypothetical protein OIO90_006608 [Microbotryomycetes sp. JL221]|nr:hypothetical protein OIO90_006608 [Microbotryomycetes sp. JL221]